ncbi:MAG TPA: transglycosylase SLT domain-containing protein [Acidimicrobiales bacterium]|nr:transglycosylase SLT domain-containing protein [Acidimicrobiales bacterium]
MSTDTLPVLDGVRAQIQRIQSLTVPLSQTAAVSQATGTPVTAAGSFASVLDSVQAAGAPASDPMAPGRAAFTSDLSAAGTGASGEQVVAGAEQYLGVPYRWGGTDPATGLDCSGLVQVVYGRLGVQLPRTSQEQQQVGVPVPSVAQAQPGDLVFYGSPAEHVGIYVGNGQMIDAPHTGTSVRIEGIGTPTSIRRIVGTGADPAAAPGLSALPGVAGAGGGSALGSVPPALAPLFLASAARYGLSPQLLAAVGKVESGFDPNAVSPAGAQGLMQLMPSTAASLGVDPLDPAQAIDGAARLLAQNLSQFGGSVPLAVAAYNAGGGAVQTYGGIPPFPETQNYVRRVLSLARGGAA